MNGIFLEHTTRVSVTLLPMADILEELPSLLANQGQAQKQPKIKLTFFQCLGLLHYTKRRKPKPTETNRVVSSNTINRALLISLIHCC